MYSRAGTLYIPIDDNISDNKKSGWIVDGQQRVAAIREAKLDQFPICVVAFIAEDVQEQREQFILVNSTKPLPKGLIYELLPETNVKLPSLLQRRRFPAKLTGRLNNDEDSPLKNMIRTPTSNEGVIKDNSIIRMIENSLSDGVLYRFRNTAKQENDVGKMLQVLKAFWSAVSEVFPHAWGLLPRKSRLMHGAGIVSLGFLMDAISDRHRSSGVLPQAAFVEDLKPTHTQLLRKLRCSSKACEQSRFASLFRQVSEVQNG
jgi:DGQHR domain-containing protein